MYWYSYYMALLVDRGLDSALAGKMRARVTEQEIGFTALVIWATQPLTWVIAFAAIEGAVRLVGAAFTETNLGTFPLFLFGKIFARLSGQSEPSAARAAGYAQGNLFSYVEAIRERSEERRVGKECRSRWSGLQSNKKGEED